MNHLSSELNKHALLREKLIVDFPAADEETLADTLDGLTGLQEVITELLRSELEDRALAKGLKGRIDEMHERLERFHVRADKKRAAALDAMEQANIKKISAPDFTASLRNVPQSVRIIDEDTLKKSVIYWDPQPAKLNRNRLKEYLKTGGTVPGASLNNPPRTISIRTK